MKCEECGATFRKVDRREEMAELEEDATEGQQADYLAAELSGDYGAWNMGIVEYRCPKCGHTLEVIHWDALPDYRNLILGWHRKAGEEDDSFSQFVFEYLAFIAHLKNNVFFETTTTERPVIQALKRDQSRQKRYVQSVSTDKQLLQALQRLQVELEKRPLYNSSHDLDNPEIDKWWNCSGMQPVADEALPKGVIRSVDDWENIVEFWYSVRNNLFHGGKNPNVKRDHFLVAHAYESLRAFMDAELEDTGRGL